MIPYMYTCNVRINKNCALQAFLRLAFLMIRPSTFLLSELPLENIGATVGAAAVTPKFRFIPDVVEKLKPVLEALGPELFLES